MTIERKSRKLQVKNPCPNHVDRSYRELRPLSWYKWLAMASYSCARILLPQVARR